MKDKETIKKAIRQIEKQLNKTDSFFSITLNSYMEGQLEALKWVLGERE